MKVELKYGRHGLAIELPGHTVVIEPEPVAGLADEKAAFTAALRKPIAGPPLRQLVKPTDTVAVVFCDITRPVPNERIIPWLLEELAGHPRERIVLINATGMHRANTAAELDAMLTPAVARNYRVVNHCSTDRSTLKHLGRDSSGAEVWLNAEYCAADVKILTGFIEPHFFAGFSGGPKLVIPGLGGAETVLHNHGSRMIAHPDATWGVTRGNPIWEEIHEVAAMTRPSFIVNVTLNKRCEITGVFAGEMDAAHACGVEFVRRTAMRAVARPFDIVVTTNSGYPLDQNLYQTVKGMSAARRIVRRGGSIVVVSECCDGIPAHGNYRAILHRAANPAEVLRNVTAPDYREIDQWEAQIQAMVQEWADVHLYSSLPADEVRRAHLKPVADVPACVAELMKKHGGDATIAVLPEGPQTIPYIASE